LRRGQSGGQDKALGFPGEEGLTLFPFERFEHSRQGFLFSILEIGQAFQDVIRVRAAGAVLVRKELEAVL